MRLFCLHPNPLPPTGLGPETASGLTHRLALTDGHTDNLGGYLEVMGFGDDERKAAAFPCPPASSPGSDVRLPQPLTSLPHSPGCCPRDLQPDCPPTPRGVGPGALQTQKAKSIGIFQQATSSHYTPCPPAPLMSWRRLTAGSLRAGDPMQTHEGTPLVFPPNTLLPSGHKSALQGCQPLCSGVSCGEQQPRSQSCFLSWNKSVFKG